jgi:uncharacterized protein (DUF2141 family)
MPSQATFLPRRAFTIGLITAAFLAAAPPGAGHTAAVELKVTATALRSTKGVVHFALYDSGEAFPTNDGILVERVVPASEAVATFSGLRPGPYAVAVYHDENANDEFDQGLFGIPLEGYAFSRGAHALFGPPDFEDARFDVGQEGAAISIPMTYW